MTGTPANARQWADADVYVAFAPEAGTLDDVVDPETVDDEFGADWDHIGLLDGEDGFTTSRDEDTTDHFAWGGIYLRTSRKNYKETHSFTALEDNDTTWRLRYPGSTRGVEIVVPSGNQIERVKIAFELRDHDIVNRLISAFEAEVTLDGDVEENEDDIAGLSFVATVFPTADGVLWTPQETESGS